MKKTWIFTFAIILNFNSCTNDTKSKNEINSSNKSIASDQQIVIGDLGALNMTVESIPFGKKGENLVFKYVIKSFHSLFTQKDGSLYIDFTFIYGEQKSGKNMKSITYLDGSLDYELTENNLWLQIKNDTRNFKNLVLEIKKEINFGKSIFFDEKSETIYIFINLTDYKGAIKIS